MISFPNAKINLGLNITEKREDGYHNLETIFLPVSIQDALEIITTENSNQEIEFTFSGLNIIGDINENLCVRAYHLLKRDFQIPSIKMHLHKAVPMGAGLGGGSADGAFTLALLNEKFELNLSSQHLVDYALHLGSDCPFFIINKPCFAMGRGEIMQEISLDLTQYEIVIINPNIHISTAKAFSKISPKTQLKSVQKIIHQPIETWKNELINDFEKALISDYPIIQHICTEKKQNKPAEVENKPKK